MAEEKRLYWLKLYESFFTTSENVDFLMTQENGSQYVVIYQMLCLKCLNTGGVLGRQLGEIFVPYDAPKIKRDLKYFSLDTIIVALELFKKLGLVYENENGVLVIADFDRLIGSESKWANYKRVEREKRKEIGHCPNDVQKMSIQSKSVELELDTHNINNGECLLGFKEKHAKIEWCYTHCQKCKECPLPDFKELNEPRILKDETESIDQELKDLLDSAYPKKR